MRLLFDLFATQPYGKVKYNGAAEYVRRVFLEFMACRDDSLELFCSYDSRFSFDETLRELCVGEGVHLIDLSGCDLVEQVQRHRIERVFLGIVQRYQRLDFPEEVEVIMVWHDVRNLEATLTRKLIENQSDISTWRGRAQRAIKRTFLGHYLKSVERKTLKSYEGVLALAQKERTRILTDSLHSKYAIVSRFHGIDKEKIEVLWCPDLAYTGDSEGCPELFGKKFWLLLGADRWEKNALAVIEALLKINQNRQEKVNLVLVGSLSNTALFGRIHQKPWIFLYDYLERRKREWLYANCSVFLFPSFVEGLGYPPIEAMKYGKPVLASATSSIMEVCGEAPLYVCPYNELEIEARLRMLLDTDLGELSAKSNIRYPQIRDRQDRDLRLIVNAISK